MRKLIVEEWMSLDGFAADKNGGLEFFTNISPEENTYSDLQQLKFLESVDTIILGRKTYELFVDFWPTATTDKEPIANALNSIPKFLVTNTLKKTSWGSWPAPSIINGDIFNKIRSMKESSGKNIVVWGSISLAQELANEGLVDEYRIQVCPVVLGDGRRLFGETDALKTLQLVAQRTYPTGIVFMNYAIPSSPGNS